MSFTDYDPMAGALEIAGMWEPQEIAGTIAEGECTLEQMAAAWGCSETTADRRLQVLVQDGKLTTRLANRDGDGHRVRVWRKV